MKARQLKNIIRESIKELINEQSNSNITVSVGDKVAVAVAYPGITNPQDLPSPMATGNNQIPYVLVMSGNTTYEFPVGSGNYVLIPGTIQFGMSCGQGKTFSINTQEQADAFNSAFQGQTGVYIEIIPSENLDDLQDLVLNTVQVDFEGPTGGCTYVGSGAGSSATPTSAPAIDSIGGVDPDEEFFGTYGLGPGNNPDAFQFPSGFNPGSWANEWVTNIFNFLSEPGGVPFGNVAQVVPNICQFLADRVTLWTNQYSTAGPLYQNQLVFKLQAAYALQDYFDCSGAPFDNTSFPFNESLNEQIEKSLPSNLKSIIAQLVQKVDRRVKQAEKEASKKDPKVDRMKKLANIKPDKK